MLKLGVIALALLCLGGCIERNGDGSPFAGESSLGAERGEVRRLVEQLAAAKTMREDVDAEVEYEEAKKALIDMGTGIQGILFEELAGNEDWGVRFGIVNVLSAIGNRRMVEPLIAVLDDPAPEVAWMAMQVLQVVCNHQIVPASEAEAVEGGLPPLPQSDGDGASQERLWHTWHALNSRQHRELWVTWWDENQHRVRID